jgi:hypothetical protein
LKSESLAKQGNAGVERIEAPEEVEGLLPVRGGGLVQRVVFDREPPEIVKAGAHRDNTEQVDKLGEHDRAGTEDANVRKPEFQAKKLLPVAGTDLDPI